MDHALRKASALQTQKGNFNALKLTKLRHYKGVRFSDFVPTNFAKDCSSAENSHLSH